MKPARRILFFYVLSLIVVGCNQQTETSKEESQTAKTEEVVEQESVTKVTDSESQSESGSSSDEAKLGKILNTKTDEVKARFGARHPQETLTFFGVKPGMTVVEALPGGGWYSKILLPYLGADGKLIGADYAADMFPLFGFFSEERIEAKKIWVKTWTAEAQMWRDDQSASIEAFQFGSMPQTMDASADAVVFIRALHNLARFEDKGGYLSKALADAKRVLKPGGIVGVVQHMVAETASDEWANGSKGYLKKSYVIAKMEQAGFEFVAASDINLNPNDQPTESDVVWRLPPSLATSRDNPELKEKLTAIGESNRMTLTFRKPTE